MAEAEFSCPSCAQRLSAEAGALRKRFRCARCGTEFRPIDVVSIDVPLPAIALGERGGPSEAGAAALLPTDERHAPGGTVLLAPPQAPTGTSPAAVGRWQAIVAALVAVAGRLGGVAGRLGAAARKLAARLTTRLGRKRALGVLVASAVAAFALLLLLVVTLARAPATAAAVGPTASASTQSDSLPPSASQAARAPSLGTDASSAEAADRDLERDGSDNVAEGVLYVPKSFHSEDGNFDLLLHFNGQGPVVAQSASRAGLNALVHVTNLERGTKYHRYLQDPGGFAALLEQIRAQAEKRGLRHAQLRRLALGSFGAGSGTLAAILGIERNRERVDAIYVLEGLQARWATKQRERVDPNEISPFVSFAKLASQGQKLFVLTHSHIGGDEKHAGATRAADAILEAVGATRAAATASPPPAELEGAGKLFGDGTVPRLEAESTAQAQGLHVLGYANSAPGHQLAHLVEMSVTVLPLLVERWSGE